MTLIVDLWLIAKKDNNIQESKSLLQSGVILQAKTLFDIMLITRNWNSGFEDVFVRDALLKPNPYLYNNTVKTESNETLIKVNPAWMTRQISEIATRDSAYMYHITSLHSLNPKNQADAFETEALNYLSTHTDEKYYYHFPESNTTEHFNLMGVLKTEKACLQCHAEQGYKEGDVRGGIRVSVPLKQYHHSLMSITKNQLQSYRMIVLSSILVALILIAIVMIVSHAQDKIKAINEQLNQKVDERTKELLALNNQLNNLNSHLEDRVQEELEKNRETQNMLLSQARSAAMGEMISIIAHQWRQPLSEIAMATNNIIIDIELDSIDPLSLKEDSESILHYVKHLSETIDDFANFFKPNRDQESVNINDVCDNAISMLSKMLQNESIMIEKKFTCNVETCLYRRELMHVIINIIKNAKDAYISNNISLRPLLISTYSDASSIEIIIEDAAGGIEEEKITHIFEPYFTTKKSHNGTGLGLYISKIIVENHLKGAISVSNTEHGARFQMTIPIQNSCNKQHLKS
jgi:C4-dicarboxylate-specific signal transduction histidine kinase